MATNATKLLTILEDWYDKNNVGAPTLSELVQVMGKPANHVSAILSTLRRNGAVNGMRPASRPANAKKTADKMDETVKAIQNMSDKDFEAALGTNVMAVKHGDRRAAEVNIEGLLEERALWHEQEAAKRYHHEWEARKLRAALAAMRETPKPEAESVEILEKKLEAAWNGQQQ